MKTTLYYFMLLLSLITTQSRAQGYLKTEYTTSSSLKNEAGERFGSGDYLKVSGGYNLHLSLKQNERMQTTLWAASLNCSYGILNNKGEATCFNPDEILNASLNLTHLRPLSDKWSLMATLGGGIYSAPNEIAARSILVNGGAIFIYRIRNNFDLGVGLGLTNSFGVPIVMPMTLVRWNLSGNYEVKVDIVSGMEVSGAVKLNDKFKIKLAALNMDGMSSVMNIDGESMIYATTTIRSFLSPEYKIGKKSTFYAGAGSTWLRSTTLTKRSLKDFFKNLFNGKDNNLEFSPGVYLTVGFRYGF